MGLVERLLDEPWSRYRAQLLGGDDWRSHLGWGPAEYLHAALIDAVQVNTAVTAAHGSGKRPRVPTAYPRPERRQHAPDTTAEDLDAADLAEIEALINE